ncbi:MAG: DUF1697 domain-containing protein [Draconibacterium sp.]
MQTYISILRGINVSGKNLLKMAALKQALEQLKFEKVTTYIQSGNIVFQSPEENSERLAETIHHQIQKSFGYDVPTQVFTAKSWKQIIDNNPFVKDKTKDTGFLHVTFLATKPEPFNNQEIFIKKMEGEEIQITSKAIHLYCPHGYGRTKLNNTFLETKLGVPATTRNWKTCLKLLEIADGLQQ